MKHFDVFAVKMCMNFLKAPTCYLQSKCINSTRDTLPVIIISGFYMVERKDFSTYFIVPHKRTVLFGDFQQQWYVRAL